MAAILFTLNNLTINLSGVNGYMDVSTYTNLDPVDYKFKIETRTGTLIYTCHANQPTPVPINGFRRTKTDETRLSFLGATFPA